MSGLTIIDWLVIVGYLVGITFVGFYASYRTKSSASFFISDRKYGRLLLFFLTMGSSSHADQAATVAAKTYTSGASGIWYQWLYLFATPFYWLLVPIVRRMRAVTVSDFFEHRYSRGTSSLYAVFGVVQMVLAIGLMLKTSGVTIEAVSSGQITEFYAILIMTVLFVAYGIVGGLNSSIYTDVVQGTLMIVLSCLIFPFALSKLGGMEGLRQTINKPEMFRLVASSEITAFYIAVLSFNGLMGYFGQPNCMLTGAGKTDFECRMGFVSGLLVKRLLTIAWTLTGLCGVAFYMGTKLSASDVDQVYGLIARDLLPQIGNGLLGLFIAAMLASMMGACNALMVTGSALLVENLYRPFVRKQRSDKHFMRMGQIAAVAIVLMAIFSAHELKSLVTGLELFMKAAAVIGVSVWVGLMWRKASVTGVWAGTLAGSAYWLFTEPISLGGFSWNFNQHFAASLSYHGKLYLPWQMLLYLSTNFVVTVLVSLITKPVAKERLDRFYECIRTPVTDAEPETTPFTLPPGVEPAPRRVLIPHPDFEIPVPSRSSVVGFLVNCALVALVIAGGYWVFSLGQ